MKKRWLIAALVTASLAILAYLNGLGGEFVLDDRAFLVDNPQLGISHNLAYFFTNNLWHYSNIPDAYSGSYRPIFFLTYWAGSQLSLVNPLALHIFSLLLHILATILVLFTIRQLIPGISPLDAGISASLFAVHPVHVEAVAWVSAFIHPLTTIFILSAYLTHGRSREQGGVMIAVSALVFFILALMSSEMAVAFPFLILLSDRARYGRMQFTGNLPYFVLLLMYLLVRHLVLGESVPLVFLNPEMWLKFPVFLLEYIRHLLLPWPQPLYLRMPASWSLSVAAALTFTLFLATMAWLGRVSVGNRKVLIIAIFWIACFLLPPLAAVFSPEARLALRSLYLPSVGIAILVAWAVDNFPATQRSPGIAIAFAFLFFALIGTVAANRHWANDGEVYRQAIAWNPDHQGGYLGLGKFYERRGEKVKALASYEEAAAVASSKEKVEPMEHMALLLGESGDNQRSLDLYKQLTLLNPKSTFAWTGVGNNLWALGQPGAAADAYLKAHNADPDDRIVCYNLVMVLNQLGLYSEASRYTECAQQQR